MNALSESVFQKLLLCMFLLLVAGFAGGLGAADVLAEEPGVSGNQQESALDLSAYKGKAVYVDFWASWCGPCRASFPMMNEMRERYPEASLAIIAVNVDSDFAAAQKFLEKYPADFDIVYDPEGKLATEYEVRGMPSSYLINAAGELVYTHVGFRKKDAKKIRQQIDNLLGKREAAEKKEL